MSSSWLGFVNTYNIQTKNLYKAMQRLSTGKKFVSPGDAPADSGIVERLELQIRNSQQASAVMQNGINMLQSIDSWQDNANQMLIRMSELAIAASDSSKSKTDLESLNMEFMQLKAEIARISESAKFNNLQINTGSAAVVYDTIEHKLVYSQTDGTDVRTVDLLLRSGNTSANSIPYCFEDVDGRPGEFLLVDKGRSLLYVAQDSDTDAGITAFKTLMKVDLRSNTVVIADPGADVGDGSDQFQNSFTQDENGEVWMSYPSTSGTGFKLARLDVNSMQLDVGTGANTKWSAAEDGESGAILMHSEFPRFAVYQNKAYFIAADETDATKINLIEQSLTNSADKKVLQKDLGANIGLGTTRKIAFSPDGQFLAFANPDNGTDTQDGTMKLVDVASGTVTSKAVGTLPTTIASLQFDRSNTLFYTDTGGPKNKNALISIAMGNGGTDGDKLALGKTTVLRNGVTGRMGLPNEAAAETFNYGLSVNGESPAVDFSFQIGPDPGMMMNVNSGDLRAGNLGITKLKITSKEDAEEALKRITDAQAKVNSSRAAIGSQIKRLEYTMASNSNYISNITDTKSSIIDSDMAEETAKITQYQMTQMASTSMLSKYNTAQQQLMNLLLS